MAANLDCARFLQFLCLGFCFISFKLNLLKDEDKLRLVSLLLVED